MISQSGQGSVFGWDDAIKGRPYQFSLKCISLAGVAIKIPVDHYKQCIDTQLLKKDLVKRLVEKNDAKIQMKFNEIRFQLHEESYLLKEQALEADGANLLAFDEPANVGDSHNKNSSRKNNQNVQPVKKVLERANSL